MIVTVLEIMWITLSIFITKKDYDAKNYKWAIINAGISGSMIVLAALDIATKYFRVVIAC